MIRRTLVTTIVALFSVLASAQTYAPILQPHETFQTLAGLPCAGCSLYSYSAGTSTPLATYTDSTGGTPNTNPVILGTDGGANIWLSTASYKFVLKDTLGSTIFTVDNVPGSASGTFAPLSGAAFTGAISGTSASFSGALTAQTVNAVYDANSYSGSDIGAKVNSVVAAICPANPLQYFATNYNAGTIKVRPGTYSYSTSIQLNCPLTLDLGDAAFTFTGSGAAIYVGPANLISIPTVHDGEYIVKNGSFTGGSGSAGGIITNYGIIHPTTIGIRYYNWLGGSTTALFDYLGSNFFIKNLWNMSTGTGGSAIGIRNFENVNNTIEIDHLIISNNCSVGVILNGIASTITNSVVEVCTSYDIQIGEAGRGSIIDNVYMEAGGNNGCIGYGDTVYSSGGALLNVQVKGSYCNAHHGDKGYTGGFLAPVNASIGMNSWTLIGNDLENTSASVMAVQNNVVTPTQPNNAGSGNFFNNNPLSSAELHTAGNHIASWIGSDGDAVIVNSNTLIPASTTSFCCSTAETTAVVLGFGSFTSAHARWSDANGNEADSGSTIVGGLANIPTSSGSYTNGNLVSNNGTSGGQQDSGIAAQAVARYCGSTSFSSGTTSGPLSCAWVTASSHCSVTWVGSTISGGVLGYTAGSGTVTLTAETSNSNSAAVFCSAN